MIDPSHPNAFEVLRLDPGAGNEEVVAQAGRLRQRATEEQELTLLRQAVQALTGSAEDRCLEQILTHPDPRYHWPALDQFRAAFRRLPPPDPAGFPPNQGAVAEEMTRENVETAWQTLIEHPFA
jgi:hypothetical protein